MLVVYKRNCCITIAVPSNHDNLITLNVWAYEKTMKPRIYVEFVFMKITHKYYMVYAPFHPSSPT